jgi:flagellar assembly protein FliH
MAKAVFRPGEVALIDEKVFLAPPHAFPELSHLAPVEEIPEDLREVEEYTGPTAEELRREAEEFKARWEIQREDMIRDAKAEAEAVLRDAREAAQRKTEQKIAEGQAEKRRAEEDAEGLITAAQEKAAALEADAQTAIKQERKTAEAQGVELGRAAGFEEGRAEVERLIERTRTALERAQDKRVEILETTEQQIIDLVLLISRKVIKVISENQRNVVISNVVHALRKFKGRGTVIIRVNLVDVKLTTEHTQRFIQLLEGGASIQVQEDSTVAPGGCIIETDFGEIDARISSQLAELESKILELSPVKGKVKPSSKGA